MAFTPEELEAMRLADEEIDREFEENCVIDRADRALSASLDELAFLESLDHKAAATRNAKKKWYAEHREEILAKQAAYRAEHREEIAARNAAYYAEHREELAAYYAAYRAEHREKIAAQQAAYYAEHREEILAKKAAYRKRGAHVGI